MRLGVVTQRRLTFAALTLLAALGVAAWLRYAPEIALCADNGGSWNAATETCDD